MTLLMSTSFFSSAGFSVVIARFWYSLASMIDLPFAKILRLYPLSKVTVQFSRP